jgi:hypothetical protein
VKHLPMDISISRCSPFSGAVHFRAPDSHHVPLSSRCFAACSLPLVNEERSQESFGARRGIRQELFRVSSALILCYPILGARRWQSLDPLKSPDNRRSMLVPHLVLPCSFRAVLNSFSACSLASRLPRLFFAEAGNIQG